MGKFILDNKTMNEIYEEIDNILVKWNPKEVSGNIALDE